MLVPAGAGFSEGLRIAAETYHELKKLLVERGLSTGVGDEGGFAPDLESSEIAIEAILDAAERAGHRDRVAIALDPASSEFFSDGRYRFEGRELAPEEMAGFYGDVAARFPLASLEDGNAEDDWDGWLATTEQLGDRLQLVGDDLFVTSPERLRLGIERGVANSILIKVNQIGTLTETIEAVRLSHESGYTAVMSHRSGETEDATIADLGWHSEPARSRPARLPGATASRSTTSSSASRRSLVTGRCTRAGGPFRACAASTLSRMAIDRRTKIVATLGPASDSRERLRALIEAGVDAVRFNLSHGAGATPSGVARTGDRGRGRPPIALIADLQGPKLRIASGRPVVLRTGIKSGSAGGGCGWRGAPTRPR
jgi:hypothetical protein